MKQILLKKIAKVASKLDHLGAEALSDRLDKVIYSLAEEIEEYKNPSYEDYKELSLEEEEEALQKEPSLHPIEEEVLEKNLDMEKDGKNIELMKRNGITPIYVQGESYLGSGAFGHVFRGVWEGKEVATKILFKNFGAGDIEAQERSSWEKYLQIQSNLSEDAKKHLPKVYKVGIDEKTESTFIIMELLAPPPPYLAKALMKREDSIRDVTYILKDPEILYTGMKKAAEEAYVPIEFVQSFLKEFLTLKIPSQKHFKDKSFLKGDFYQQYIMPIQNKVNKEYGLDEDYVNEFVHIFLNYLQDYMRPNFPSTGVYYESLKNYSVPGVSDAPETKSLIKALSELRKAGLSWRDMHLGNVMMRPSTNELVFIDIGGFEEL